VDKGDIGAYKTVGRFLQKRKKKKEKRKKKEKKEKRNCR
jgi:hypothetical protein